MRKNEPLDEMVARRNKRLKKIFTINGYNVRLIGDEQKPAVIMGEKMVVSCYVKNFDLHFTKEPFSDEIVQSFKLKHEPEVSKFEFEQVVDMCIHRPVYKVKLVGTGLYLVGYNYLNQEDSVGRYPVFGRHKPKVYFKKEYAEKITTTLSEDNYQVEIE
jgi:hypothetical protein